ncbi:hypothetical protein JZ751_021947 [Albula glossodonta]|uniref:Uncharacterized protein n=1 Tax=Albula glossodonta TaxID=121402 RepID=A0A8T2MT39_9TELE|nr:hypothetical protein JZ751_021947 [Albula glossodonta]
MVMAEGRDCAGETSSPLLLILHFNHGALMQRDHIQSLTLLEECTCGRIDMKVQKFNRESPEPDVSQEERSHGFPSPTHPLCTETGFRYGTRSTLPIILCFKLHPSSAPPPDPQSMGESYRSQQWACQERQPCVCHATCGPDVCSIPPPNYIIGVIISPNKHWRPCAGPLQAEVRPSESGLDAPRSISLLLSSGGSETRDTHGGPLYHPSVPGQQLLSCKRLAGPCRGPACSSVSRHGEISSLGTGREEGWRGRDGSNLEDVVEKQADLIEYLKQHNSLLSKRILSLTAQQIRD